MIKLGRTDVMNIENAIRGMRNPMNSWDKSDSGFGCRFYDRVLLCDKCEDKCGNCGRHYVLGSDDLNLAQRLCKAGSDHRKFMRQIFVSVDITAPLYWWKEYDTYKVGTVANSTSTMHKIHAKEFTLEDFSHERMVYGTKYILTKYIIPNLNELREEFNEHKDKKVWYSMIQLLPCCYNQLRTCTLTYENLRNMYHARKNHKLDEWVQFTEWIKSLPYSKELIIGE